MATQPTHLQHPGPDRIMQTLSAYQQTYALRTAIELEIFTHIGQGATTADAIAQRCHASERGVRILCDYLTVIGFLTKSGNNYGLTPEAAAFLDQRSPAYIGSMAGFLAHDKHTERYRDLTGAVRRGGLMDDGHMGPNDPIWVEFARSMAPMMRMNAERVAPLVAEQGRALKVLDIAAGHGWYGIAVAKHNSAAEVYGVDWPNVLAVATEHAAEAGVASRYHTIPGSAFDVDFGTAYDLVLLPAFLHHFDVPTNTALLRKIRAALKPGGRLATLEMVPNEDRVSPPFAAAFSLMMLGSTPAGDAYTYRELEGMLRDAGFQDNRLQSLDPMPMAMVLSRA